VAVDIVALAGVFVAIGIFILQGRKANYIRRQEFADSYVQRYWEIREKFPMRVRIDGYLRTGGELRLDEEQVRAIWDYLELCEDEIDLRKQGTITYETWKIWAEGIESSVASYPFKGFMDDLEAELERNAVPVSRRPFSNLRQLRDSGHTTIGDPFKVCVFRQWATGSRLRCW
jgi:hypothetical protein